MPLMSVLMAIFVFKQIVIYFSLFHVSPRMQNFSTPFVLLVALFSILLWIRTKKVRRREEIRELLTHSSCIYLRQEKIYLKSSSASYKKFDKKNLK